MGMCGLPCPRRGPEAVVPGTYGGLVSLGRGPLCLQPVVCKEADDQIGIVDAESACRSWKGGWVSVTDPYHRDRRGRIPTLNA